MHTQTSLQNDLRRLGVTAGDLLLVHSSYKSLGAVAGGGGTVLDALQAALGPAGTLVLPSFPSGSEFLLAQSGIVFDVRETPSGCGYLTELFRQRPGVQRSLSPTHSLAACGLRARELLADHEKCLVTAGAGSPFEKLSRWGGKILLLGSPEAANTFLHYVENTGGAPTVSALRFDTAVIDADGLRHATPIYPHMPGLLRDYPRGMRMLEEAGLLRTGLVGDVPCRLFRADDLERLGKAALRENPCAFITVFQPPAIPQP